MINQFQIRLSCVVSAHSIKHLSVATLSWNVHLFAHVGSLCDHIKKRIGEVFRVGRRESEANFWGSFRNHRHQICKSVTFTSPQFEHLLKTCRILMSTLDDRRLLLNLSRFLFVLVLISILILILMMNL